MDTKQSESESFVIERVFDAPRERVWQAWTDPELLKRWWGPKDFTAPVIQVDLRVGGKYVFSMQAPDGKIILWSTGTYREIVPPKRLVATDSFADEKGNVVPASDYGMDEWPLELVMTVTLEAEGDKTRMTLSEPGMPAGQDREMARAGMMESFDKLAALLK